MIEHGARVESSGRRRVSRGFTNLEDAFEWNFVQPTWHNRLWANEPIAEREPTTSPGEMLGNTACRGSMISSLDEGQGYVRAIYEHSTATEPIVLPPAWKNRES
jgi:hypothetical protein